MVLCEAALLNPTEDHSLHSASSEVMSKHCFKFRPVSLFVPHTGLLILLLLFFFFAVADPVAFKYEAIYPRGHLRVFLRATEPLRTHREGRGSLGGGGGAFTRG